MSRIACFVLVCCALIAPVTNASPVTVTKIKDPVWAPADFNLVSATVGTSATGYAEYFKLTGEQILTPPSYKNYPGVGAGPGDPEAPPYDKDISNGLKALNLTNSSTFSTKDFSNGKGVMLAFMVIASGDATGSSPDYANGAIIPNKEYPIHVHGQSHQNGANFDSASDFPAPAVTTLDPKFAGVDGASHFPFFFFDNGDFATNPKASLTGSYDFDITMTDKSGAGYRIVAPFTVTSGATAIPLPAAIWPGILLLASLASLPLARKLCRR